MRPILFAVAAFIVMISLASPIIATEALVYDLTTLEAGFYCGDLGIPGGVAFTVYEQERGVCSGGNGCWGSVDSEGLTLYFSSLEVHVFDLNIWGIDSCEVDLVEHDVDLSANLSRWGQESVYATETGLTTLRIASTGGGVISCCNCTVVEVRLVGDNIVPAQRSSWGTLKFRY